jgi:hypothetical protein
LPGDARVMLVRGPVNWTHGRAAHSVRSLPPKRGKVGAGVSCAAIDPHPLAALHSRCFASAFLALRTAAEGRLCSPFQGETTELAGRADSISAEAVLVSVKKDESRE